MRKITSIFLIVLSTILFVSKASAATVLEHGKTYNKSTYVKLTDITLSYYENDKNGKKTNGYYNVVTLQIQNKSKVNQQLDFSNATMNGLDKQFKAIPGAALKLFVIPDIITIKPGKTKNVRLVFSIKDQAQYDLYDLGTSYGMGFKFKAKVKDWYNINHVFKYFQTDY